MAKMIQIRALRRPSTISPLAIRRHSHFDLLGRAWELRDNFTAYDAIYVALAEALDAPLVTCDGPLAAAPGHTALIEVVL